MTVAQVEIREHNGSSASTNPPPSVDTTGSVTDDVSNLNLVSINGAEQSSSAYPVTAGNRSFSKWVTYRLVLSNDSNKIDNFQVWMTPAASATGIAYKTNLNTTLTNTTSIYPAPPTANVFTGVGEGGVTTESDFPTADPTAENIGVSEASTGLTVDATNSDFIAIQLVTTGSTPPGNLSQKTFHFQYDEQ